MHIVRLLNTISDLVDGKFNQKIVDGKFNRNISILLSLKSYLVTLQYA